VTIADDSRPLTDMEKALRADRDRLAAQLADMQASRDQSHREYLLTRSNLESMTRDRNVIAARVRELESQRDAAVQERNVAWRHLNLSRPETEESLTRLTAERDAALARVAELERDRLGRTTAPTEWIDKLTAQAGGRCLGTIGFIACGEGGNYCSVACLLRAERDAARQDAERMRPVYVAAVKVSQLRERQHGLDDLHYDQLDNEIGEALDALDAAIASGESKEPK
jgi:hypothetical protein